MTSSNELPASNSQALPVNEALQQAMAHHHKGQLQEAERLYRAILQTQPSHPDANHNLGVLAVQVKQPAVGLPHFKAALETRPDVEQYWLSYVDALIQADQRDAAKGVLEQGRQRGLQGEAVEAVAMRLEELPGSEPSREQIDALARMFAEGRYAEAASLANALTERFPLHGFGWKVLGAVLNQTGRTSEALLPMRKAAALMPRDAEAHNNLGVALHDLRLLDDAVASCRRALEIKPDFAEAHNNLGNALRDLGKVDDAVASYRRALEIKPDFAKAHSNLGNALRDLGFLDDAVASCRRALEIGSSYAEAHNNLGIALHDLGKVDDAVTSYRRALEIGSSYAEAHSNLGVALLLKGTFEEGWRHYESRFDPRTKRRSSIPPVTTIPQWQGESLGGKSLLVWHEQGMGDQIQFCRYVPMLREQGTRRITMVCAPPLKALLQRLDVADEVITSAEAENIPPHDYWAFPLSLPLHCNTTLENIPAVIPYLCADDKFQQKVATQLAYMSEFKVGLCWKGAKGYPKDAERSPGLEPFKQLFNLKGARFFTLQSSSRDEFLLAAGSAAFDIGHEIDALTPPFEETAALIMNLDLVITCDTSIGHLAGALGKPVWVVLPFVPDWRWMMDREDSPWYPKTRLFRQAKRGDWVELFERVAQRLKSVIAGESPALWSIAKTE